MEKMSLKENFFFCFAFIYRTEISATYATNRICL